MYINIHVAFYVQMGKCVNWVGYNIKCCIYCSLSRWLKNATNQ